MEKFDYKKHIRIYSDPSNLTRVSFNNCILNEKDNEWINNYLLNYHITNKMVIFEFKDVFFENFFKIRNSNDEFPIEFINCSSTFQTNIILNGNFFLVQIINCNFYHFGFLGNIKGIHITNCQIKKIIFAGEEGQLINTITINHSDLNENSEINFNNVIIDIFSMSLTHDEKNNKASLLSFSFNNFIECRNFTIKSKHNHIPNVLIKEFFISDKEYSDHLKNKVDFNIKKILLSDLNINIFKLSGNIISTILIKNLKINSLRIIELTNIKKLVFNNISNYIIEHKSSELILSNSDLSNIIFSESNLDSFDKFIFEDNYINSITFDSCNMPSNEKIKSNSNSLSIARNFKNIFKKQEDKHLFLQFLSLENNIQLKKGKLNWIDRTILFSSKVSNNFGINPLRSTIFTLITAIITFTFSLTNTSLFELSYNFNLNDLQESSKYYWQFILPTHRFDYLEKGNEKIIYDYGFYFWDFLGRIFVGFGIYQTIASFRKYSS